MLLRKEYRYFSLFVFKIYVLLDIFVQHFLKICKYAYEPYENYYIFHYIENYNVKDKYYTNSENTHIYHFFQEHRYCEPRLVAVSKLQSTESILSAYKAGQRHFGENYVNELVEKALNPQILEKCKEIQWHFIGNLQRNKINKILSVPNLYVIETVSNDKLADVLNNSWPKFRKSDNSKLNVMVQVNTSREEGS